MLLIYKILTMNIRIYQYRTKLYPKYKLDIMTDRYFKFRVINSINFTFMLFQQLVYEHFKLTAQHNNFYSIFV